MRLAALEVLSPAEIDSIHDATVHILQTAGVKVLGKRMLSLLRDKGCRVDSDRGVAYFTRSMVDSALDSVPRTFELFDRTGKSAFLLGDRIPRSRPGTTRSTGWTARAAKRAPPA